MYVCRMCVILNFKFLKRVMDSYVCVYYTTVGLVQGKNDEDAGGICVHAID